jgi:hypothetical protein
VLWQNGKEFAAKTNAEISGYRKEQIYIGESI